MDQQQNQIISLIAVFLALGIGILIGASTGEKALVMHQLAFIEELKGEILYYKEEIDSHLNSFLKLQQELSEWESLEEEYLVPLLLENSLENVKVIVISHKNIDEELISFLQKSSCFYSIYYVEESPIDEISLTQAPIIILSGTIYSSSSDSSLSSILEKLHNQGKFIIQIKTEERDLQIAFKNFPIAAVENIDKFYNKIKLLKMIKEYINQQKEKE